MKNKIGNKMGREEYEIYIDMEKEFDNFSFLLDYIKSDFPDLKIQMKYPEQNVIQFMFLDNLGFCSLSKKSLIIKFFLDFNSLVFTNNFQQLINHNYFKGKRLRGFLSSDRGYDDELNIENEFEYFDTIWPINVFNELDFKNIDKKKLLNIANLIKGKINDVYFESNNSSFILLKLEKISNNKKKDYFYFGKKEVSIIRDILLKSNKKNEEIN